MDNTKMMAPNLQYFADEGGADTTQGQPTTQPATNPPAGQETTPATHPPAPEPPADLNAMLAGDKALQSQYDQLIGKALTTARGKWEQQQSMTADQLAEQATQEQAAALAAREQALVARELRAEAMGELSKRSLPADLISCIQTTDTVTMQASLKAAETAFRAAVQAGVEARMAGGTPKGNGNGTDSEAARISAVFAQ